MSFLKDIGNLFKNSPIGEMCRGRSPLDSFKDEGKTIWDTTKDVGKCAWGTIKDSPIGEMCQGRSPLDTFKDEWDVHKDAWVG